MSHVHYEEEQRFTQLRWVWILSLILLLVPIVLFSLGKMEMASDAWMAGLTFLAAYAPVVVILVWSRLLLKIDTTGVHYRFPPSVRKWKTIPHKLIDSVEVRAKQGFFDHLACGYKKRLFKKSTFMNIIGNKFVIIRLLDGSRLKIGSTHAEEMLWNIKRLLNQENISNDATEKTIRTEA